MSSSVRGFFFLGRCSRRRQHPAKVVVLCPNEKEETGKGEQQDEKQKKETSWERKRSNEEKKIQRRSRKGKRRVKVASVNKKSDKCNDENARKKERK